MTTRSRSRAGAALAAGALALALACIAGAARGADIGKLTDDLVRQGTETPGAAIRSLENLQRTGTATTVQEQRSLALAIGLVAARSGRVVEAEGQVGAVRAIGPRDDALAEADARLIGAAVEDNAGHAETAYAQARAALDGYGPACEPGPGQRAECDYRAWWSALDLASAGATGQGNAVVANTYAEKMLAIARRAGDRPREARALAFGAYLAEADGDSTRASRLLAQAKRLARLEGAPWLQIHVALADAIVHATRQQPQASVRAYETALAMATAAGYERQAMQVRANLSDEYLVQGRPAQALAAIAAALPAARSHRDSNWERTLLHNAALAHLALGHVAKAKAQLPRVLELWERDTGLAQQAEALQEFGDALEKAGDLAGAIELFHKEEALQERVRALNKAAAEADMHARYDQESQQRRIELLARDNQLKGAQLENQTLTRHLWMFAGAALVLMGVLAVLMYLRMRELNRNLVKHEALLRAHSERDALTGLANRRQFREVMRVRGSSAGERSFSGALLMVDVDHFKHVNDRHGHAAGDRVLVEVARRLGAAMRTGDLVARWGGEEFLVFAPGVVGAELDQLAERVRRAIGDKPIAIDGGTLQATASIGYAAFPLPESHVPVTWEQAVNLADLSLYTAKNNGRNCAVGIVGTTAASSAALREVEADLSRAHQDGRVTLRVLSGIVGGRSQIPTSLRPGAEAGTSPDHAELPEAATESA